MSIIRQGLHDHVFDGLEIHGEDVSRCAISYVNFRNCRITATQFDFTCLSNVVFDKCVIIGARFFHADLRSVKFNDCDIKANNFSHATLSDVDFVNCAMPWTDHTVVSYLLWRHSEGNIAKRKVASYIGRERNKCWPEFLELNDPLTDWAIATLSKYDAKIKDQK